MSEKEFYNSLYTKLFSGTVSEEEADQLMQYLQESRENRLDYFRMKRIWQDSHRTANEAAKTKTSWDRLKIRIDESEKEERPARGSGFRHTWRRVAVAASLTILVAVSGYLAFQTRQTSQLLASEVQVNAPLGSRSHVVLPDGSTVWLNSGSQLAYNYDYGKVGRKVRLTGEAYFDIQHANNTPFVVNTSDLEISVLGTKFNVKSYPDEQVIETTLIQGKIEVNKINGVEGDAAITMTPNQKLIYTKKEMLAELQTAPDQPEPVEETETRELSEMSIKIIKKTNPQDEASWKDGKLIIKSESLEALATKLERYYNVNISFQDESIKSFTFSGTLDEVTIEEVLRALEKTSPIRFSIEKEEVLLTLSNTK